MYQLTYLVVILTLFYDFYLFKEFVYFQLVDFILEYNFRLRVKMEQKEPNSYLVPSAHQPLPPSVAHSMFSYT